ncbi:uncharacterized protein LOC115667611 isoform X3 [Syzygium oleosum]|uniref:uncharacterized protein LOC115667611 isoform X3 n=1 Tax=Syzygium oleosum TaxID=219896 RepID=UPI0024BA8C0A|nr:uncharacterized protein LOC115667611 isoform X3 [Syzygium oleosum]XP_056166911.1 uncharacterized protein LOC115667611 isoform X3 [Syzygium oleosum]
MHGRMTIRRKAEDSGMECSIYMFHRYLDTVGMKKSKAYLINGVVIFLSWLVARILLFVYMFYHVYLHLHQVNEMRVSGKFLVFGAPLALTVMNLLWFEKIIKGLKKTIAKRQ